MSEANPEYVGDPKWGLLRVPSVDDGIRDLLVGLWSFSERVGLEGLQKTQLPALASGTGPIELFGSDVALRFLQRKLDAFGIDVEVTFEEGAALPGPNPHDTVGACVALLTRVEEQRELNPNSVGATALADELDARLADLSSMERVTAYRLAGEQSSLLDRPVWSRAPALPRYEVERRRAA